MSKPYQDELKEKNPKEYIRYLIDHKGYNFSSLSKKLYGTTDRRGSIAKWYYTKEEKDYATEFKTEASKDKARDRIKYSPVFKEDISKRVWYSRQPLGRSRKGGTPKADIVCYFNAERLISDVIRYTDAYDTNGALKNHSFELREVEGDYIEGISIIQTDKRNGTHHSEFKNNSWTTTQTNLLRFIE